MMKIRWPFMLRRTHERLWQAVLEECQTKVNQAYDQATTDGRAQVHEYARDANWNIFWGLDGNGPQSSQNMRGDQRSKSYAALQGMEHTFKPTPPAVTQSEEEEKF